jgi:hypothetical protein
VTEYVQALLFLNFVFAVDGSEVLFKTENLTTLEFLTNFNHMVSAKAPKKQEVAVVLTKAEKAAAVGGAKKKWK